MYKDQDYESTVVLWKTYSFPRESLARAIVSFFTEIFPSPSAEEKHYNKPCLLKQVDDYIWNQCMARVYFFPRYSGSIA